MGLAAALAFPSLTPAQSKASSASQKAAAGSFNPHDLSGKWNRYSFVHWEGGTFVVSLVGFDERTWLDHNGYPHTEDMKLEERYRRINANTLELTETITDPKYYTKPWCSDTKTWKLDPVGG